MDSDTRQSLFGHRMVTGLEVEMDRVLRTVKKSLEEGRFFAKPERFSLKPGVDLNALREAVEGDLALALSEKGDQEWDLKERSRLREEGVNLWTREGIDKLVRRAKDAVELLYNCVIIDDGEVERLSNKIEDELKPCLESKQKDDSETALKGRPDKHYKLRSTGLLKDHFKKFTNLRQEDIFKEIAGLFLACGLADTTCAPDERTQKSVRVGFKPVLKNGRLEIGETPPYFEGRSRCKWFEYGVGIPRCDALRQGYCARLTDSLKREWKRWEAEKRRRYKEKKEAIIRAKVRELEAEGYRVIVNSWCETHSGCGVL